MCRRLDHYNDGDYTEAGSGIYYHLTDSQFSTVAILDQNSGLLERVTYDPYGRPRQHRMADVDGDGDTDSGDLNTIYNLGPGGFGLGYTPINDSNYNVDCDIDRDGDIDSSDYSKANGIGTQTALSLGTLSNIGNVYGFSGYVYNVETRDAGMSGGVYTVRFRHYDTGLGRWLERDPLQYVDGMNLFEYCQGMVLRSLDPFGLDNETWDQLPDWVKDSYKNLGITRHAPTPQTDLGLWTEFWAGNGGAFVEGVVEGAAWGVGAVAVLAAVPVLTLPRSLSALDRWY